MFDFNNFQNFNYIVFVCIQSKLLCKVALIGGHCLISGPRAVAFSPEWAGQRWTEFLLCSVDESTYLLLLFDNE